MMIFAALQIWSGPWTVAAGAMVAFAALLILKGRKGTLFGPVLYYDLLRNGRRGQLVLWRGLYAFVLLYTLVFVYLSCLVRYADPGHDLWKFLAGRTLTKQNLSDITSYFFGWLALMQMIAVSLLTPAYTAGAVAAERERATLQDLFCTDLKNREIVFSMLVSRLANLTLVIITGVPMLMLLEFMGGIDPAQVLALFLASAFTMLGIGSLGIYASVHFAKPRQAIMSTYLWVLTYFTVSLLSRLLLTPALGIASWPSSSSPVRVATVIECLGAGNWLAQLLWIRDQMKPGVPMDVFVQTALWRYAAFHVALSMASLTAAVLSLRARALTEQSRGQVAESDLRVGMIRFLLLRCSPLLWKDLVVLPANRSRWWKSLFYGVGLALLLWPILHCMFWFGSWTSLTKWLGSLGGIVNIWIRIVTGILGTVLLLQVGVRASGLISGERARGTLDALLAAPVSAEAVLRAKLLTSLAANRALALIVAIVWLIGIGIGAIDPVAALWVAGLWVVIAMYMASLGTYFSIVATNTGRAALFTLLAAGGTLAIITLLAVDLTPRNIEAGVLVPPVGLAAFAFPPGTFMDEGPFKGDLVWLLRPERTMVRYVAAGSVLWLSLALFVAWLARCRFRLLLGRTRQGQMKAELSVRLASIDASQSHSRKHAGHQEHAFGEAPKAWHPQQAWHPWQACRAFLSDVCWSLEQFRLPRLRATVLLACLPIAAAGAWYGHLAQLSSDRLEQACRRAYETDGPWRSADRVPRANKASADQAGMLIVEADELLKFKRYNMANVRTLDWVLREGVSQSPDQLALVQSIVRDHADIAAKILPLADYSAATLPPDQAADEKFLDRVHHGPLQSLVRCAVLDSINRRDWDKAIRFLKCSLMLRERGTAANDVEIDAWLREILQSHAVSENALRDLQAMMEDRAAEPLFVSTMRSARAATLDQFRKVQSGLSPRLIVWPFYAWDWAQLTGPDQRKQAAEQIDRCTDVIEVMKLPEATQARRLTALGRWSQQIVDLKNTDARRRVAAVMVALERFRLANNRWPRALAELTLVYMKSIPTDPYDGKPLRYVAGPRSIPFGGVLSVRAVVYSIGPDLVDDGGWIWPAPKTPGPAKDVGYDLVFTLARRQL
jgi:ABC-type transport system involved in multi-copper enzyme maturation permease subunit